MTFSAAPLSAQTRVEENVVYGMYSGLALLMNVHHPAEPNGRGLIVIWGSGWWGPTTYGSWQLKERGVPQIFIDVGYTVFVINHRQTPRFRYPAAVEDVQRAVRYVRYNAERYGIDPDQLGGWGGSSGGHLISMLATMDGHGDPDDSDPVNRESAKLQAVVAQAGAFDFAATADQYGDFLSPLIDAADYREGSPITYVTPDDPPLLLIHGDADPMVPFQQSELMLAALEEQGVETRLIRIPGGGHGANDVPESVRWLNQHLLGEAGAAALEYVIAAYARLAEGRRLARAGNTSEAVAAYRIAQERYARLTITASDWNQLCWNGSLWGHAAEVMAACEKAVALAPDHGGIRDSRGLARALTGDVAGAIDDFKAFVASTGNDRSRAQRQDWIDALRAGRNPFTKELLDQLRG
ncbi:MAG: prolyl oligopeptidase family serine peptidase [Gemmatimonadetes bacterium]|nr:prolyl oligopeptidase family serine peptidase [Gemmatimonadota bacterium]